MMREAVLCLMARALGSKVLDQDGPGAVVVNLMLNSIDRAVTKRGSNGSVLLPRSSMLASRVGCVCGGILDSHFHAIREV